MQCCGKCYRQRPDIEFQGRLDGGQFSTCLRCRKNARKNNLRRRLTLVTSSDDTKHCQCCYKEYPLENFIRGRNGKLRITCNPCAERAKVQVRRKAASKASSEEHICTDAPHYTKRCIGCHKIFPVAEFERYGIRFATCQHCSELRSNSSTRRPQAAPTRSAEVDKAESLTRCTSCHTVLPGADFERRGKHFCTCNYCYESRRWYRQKKSGNLAQPDLSKRCTDCKEVKSATEFERGTRTYRICNQCSEMRTRTTSAQEQVKEPALLDAAVSSAQDNPTQANGRIEDKRSSSTPSSLPQARPAALDGAKRYYHVNTRLPLALPTSRTPFFPSISGLRWNASTHLPYRTIIGSNNFHGLAAMALSACRRVRLL